MDSQCHYQAWSSLLSLPFYWSTCLFFNYLEILDNSKIPVWTAKQNTWKASREIQQPAFWEVANQQLILRTGLQSVWEKLLLFVLSPQLHVTPTNLQPMDCLWKPKFQRPAGVTEQVQQAVLLPWTSLNQRTNSSNTALPIPLRFTWQLSLHTSEVKLCSRPAGGRQEWGYKTQANCWFALLNPTLPKDTKLPIPQWSLPFILHPWSGHIHLQWCWLLKISCHLNSMKRKKVIIGMTCFYRLWVIYYENGYYL